ncbi:MAG: DUF935 family protein [Thermofilaceae archaeon]
MALAERDTLLYNYISAVLRQSPSLETYHVMYLTDETIASAVDFLTYNIFSFWGDYVHPNPQITAFVKENLENLETSLESTLQRVVKNAIVYGHCFSEIVLEKKNGKYYLSEIVPLHPLLCSPVVEKGKLTKVLHQNDDQTVEIPASKLFVFKVGEGLLGESFLRRIYRIYSIKRGFLMFWATAMERYAMPTVFARGPKAREILDELRNVWSNGIIVTENPNLSIELLEARTDVSATFVDAIEYLNVLIYRGLLMPQLLASVRSTGTYALGKVHFEMFAMAARRITTQLAEAFVDQVIARLIENNFSDVVEYGQIIVTEQPSSDERFKLAQAFSMLVEAGIVDPVKDNEWIRNMLKLPIVEDKEETEEEEAQYFELLKRVEGWASPTQRESMTGSENAT